MRQQAFHTPIDPISPSAAPSGVSLVVHLISLSAAPSGVSLVVDKTVAGTGSHW